MVNDGMATMERPQEIPAPMTVEQMVVALLRVRDPEAIPEFTLDGETYFQVIAINAQPDGNVSMEVEPW